MPTRQALQVCPDLILLPHTAGLYGEVSRRMFDLCEQLTPLVQRNSIDEGYLDLVALRLEEHSRDRGGRPRAPGADLGRAADPGVPGHRRATSSWRRSPPSCASRGASWSCRPGRKRPSSRRWGSGGCRESGRRRRPRLARHGIRFVRDVFARSEDGARGDLRRRLARRCSPEARGEDDRPVETEEEAAKSYSEQETFRPRRRRFRARSSGSPRGCSTTSCRRCAPTGSGCGR